MKKNSLLVLSFCVCIGLNSCVQAQHFPDEIFSIPSENSTIAVKISYPEKWTKSDKIIIWSNYPLATEFLPDSVPDARDVYMSPILKKALLDSGYVNIEYIGRQDSIEYVGRKYNISDSNTKATDLENLLAHIETMRHLKNKKIILVGYSEGGEINSIVASQKQSTVFAMVQLASPSVSGEEQARYQHEQNISGPLSTPMLIIIGCGDQEDMDQMTNRVSSLDSYHTADVAGLRQFFEENYQPVYDLIYQYETMDSIYDHINSYMQHRWQKENEDSKEFWKNDFEFYYSLFAGSITPQQISIRLFNPEKYYPFISCPVLAVNGTEDKQVECDPNLSRMEQLLKEGGNTKFQKIKLDGYGHKLAKSKGSNQFFVEESAIRQIIDWIDEQ